LTVLKAKAHGNKFISVELRLEHNLEKFPFVFRQHSKDLQPTVLDLEEDLNMALPLRMYIDQLTSQQFVLEGEWFSPWEWGIHVVPESREGALRGIEFGRPAINFGKPTTVALTKGDGIVEFVTVTELPGTSPHPFIEEVFDKNFKKITTSVRLMLKAALEDIKVKREAAGTV
jgi:hypothetical protein